MNTTPRPTPETDAAALKGAYFNDAADYPETKGKQLVHIDDARKLERERDEAKEQLEAMRTAIKEASKIVVSIQLNDIFEETMRNHAAYALAKLQPFLKP